MTRGLKAGIRSAGLRGGLATARLAWPKLDHDRATNRAEFLSRRAVQLAPTNAAVQQARAEVLKKLGR